MLLTISDEAKATATTGVAVLDDNLHWILARCAPKNGLAQVYCFLNGAKLFELCAKSGVVGVPGKATGRESAACSC